MFKERLLLPFVAVAGALLVAGCGGSSGGGGSDPAQAAGTTGVMLPSGNQLEPGRHTIAQGNYVDVRGVRFSCPVIAASDEDCTVVIEEAGAQYASYSGTMASAEALPTGFQLGVNLGEYLRSLFDADGVPLETAGPDGMLADNPATTGADDDESADNSTSIADYVPSLHSGTYMRDEDGEEGNGKIALTHTTHGADTINDMDAAVTPDDARTDMFAETHIFTGGAEGGEPITREAVFNALARWRQAQNEADNWDLMLDLTPPVYPPDHDLAGELMFPASTEIANDEWTHSLYVVNEDHEGGRTVMLDLYSDFNENEAKAVSSITQEQETADPVLGTMNLMVTLIPATPDTDLEDELDDSVAFAWTFGMGGNADAPFPATSEVVIDRGIIKFLDPLFESPDALEIGERQELRPATADDDADIVAGLWRGIPGVFECMATPAPGGNGNCFIRAQQGGDGGVTSGGVIRFTPAAGAMIMDMDTDWLTAGVWLTVPDDPDGDYAGGAFVHGGEPYPAASLLVLTGDAKYSGQAVGRYAEDDQGDPATGRFTATASLTARFGDADAMGSIDGSVTKFATTEEGATTAEMQPDWDLNLDVAMIPMNDTNTVDVNEDNGRFGSQVSGHAHGNALDGAWAGQFFNNREVENDEATQDVDESMAENYPGAVAGTFGASDRDPDDGYSLTLFGAFAADYEPPADDDAEDGM